MSGKEGDTAAGRKTLTRENAIARRRKAAARGASVKDLITALEKECPDLASKAPLSSAAAEAGDFVRSARLGRDMSQKELASAAGLQQSAVSAIERGEGKDGPTYRTLRDIAEALGMKVAFVPKSG